MGGLPWVVATNFAGAIIRWLGFGLWRLVG